MRSEKLQDAIGEVRDAFIQDADVVPAKKKNAWVKWAAVAACAAIVIAAAGIPSLLQKTDGLADTEQSEQPSEAQTVVLQDLFEQYGLPAQLVDDPMDVAVGETPQITREEAAAHLKNAELLLECTVEEISRVRIEEPDSGSTWYITAMTLSLNSVIHGDVQEDRFRVVNAAVTNEPMEFLSYPGLEECREQTRAAFVLRKLDGSEVWTIGGTSLPVSEFGEYTAVGCMGFDCETFHYLGYDIPLSELNQ